jgi:hypothetical protein
VEKKKPNLRARGGKSKMNAKGTVRARPEDNLDRIKSERLRVATDLADELQFEHDFGVSPRNVPEPKEKPYGRTNHD